MNKLDKALAELFKIRRRLQDGQGRIARLNARSAVLGATRAVVNAVKKEYPLVVVPKEPVDYLLNKAKKVRWRVFEHRYVKPGSFEFTFERAQAFVDWWCARNSFPSKRVVQDVGGQRGDGGLLGQHGDRIRLRYEMTDQNKWRVLIHEVAHYRHHGHARAFTLEMKRVYDEFRYWRQEISKKKAAERETKNEDQCL